MISNDLKGAPVPKSYPLFDWLRLILASIVVIVHAGVPLPDVIGGAMAVKVFFALSGWLIGGILINMTRADIPRFFFNRSTRIWIPYAFAMLLLYGVALGKEGISFFWLKYLVLDVTFTHQIFTVFPAALQEMPLDGSGNQFWSISVEEQFYLLAPLLVLFVKGGRTVWLWLPVAVIMIAMQLHFGAIALGVVAAIVDKKTHFTRHAGVRWVALALALVFAAVIWSQDSIEYFGAFLAVSVVIAMAKPGKRSSIAKIAGGISYPLYLNHWIGVFAVNFVTNRFVSIDFSTFVVVQYVINIAIALALYWMIDQRIQANRNGWYSARLGYGLAMTSYILVAVGLVLGTLMHVYGPRAG